MTHNGANASFGETMHCVAAEPYATFLHISVTDNGEEVAYESAVLGRLLNGYRVMQLRSALGTRIELCYLFVHITNVGSETNLWSTRQASFVPSAGVCTADLAACTRSRPGANQQQAERGKRDAQAAAS